jgi:hypothetical protein
MQFRGSNSQGFAREAMEKVEELQWRVRERERAVVWALGSGSGRSKLWRLLEGTRRYK